LTGALTGVPKRLHSSERRKRSELREAMKWLNSNSPGFPSVIPGYSNYAPPGLLIVPGFSSSRAAHRP
jgi:hypothetical protein